MASTARPSKPQRKGGPEPARRTQAWTGARASPTFSPANTPRPQPNTSTPTTNPQQQQQQSGPASFPPLAHPNGLRGDPTRDRVLMSLTGLTGTTVTLTTKTGQRYEGVVGSTNGEGDTTGVTLKDVKDLTTAGAPLKDSLFIAATNIDSYLSGPADARPTNGDTFRTDTDISARKGPGRERELQAWVPPPTSGGGGALELGASSTASTNDEDTFGPNAGSGGWDQFSANEQLFGVTVNFDEDVYTTTIDRSAPDFKERERKAQRIANEIMGTATNNPHIAEERGQTVDDSGVNEEDKYGAVVRGQNAYVPPGARARANGAPASVATKTEVPKVSVNGPDGATVATSQSPIPSKTSSPAPANKPADPLPAFREFVTHEKQRLNQKRQALAKSEMDKRMAELVKFSQNFKLKQPIPDDLVPILAKDEEKQKAIKEKAKKDSESTEARAIGASTPATASRGVLAPKVGDARKQASQLPASKTVANNIGEPGASASSSSSSSAQKPTTVAASSSAAPTSKAGASAEPGSSGGGVQKKIPMFIAAIPPFKGTRSKPASSGASSSATTPPVKVTSSNGNAGTPLSPGNASARLNVNAPSFRARGSASPSVSAASASASPKPHKAESAPATPNPFFGPRVVKKSTPFNVKEDFNPFKHSKVVDASQVVPTWPYSGKRYHLQYPPPPHAQAPGPHPPHAPSGPHAVGSPMAPPPPSYVSGAGGAGGAGGGAGGGGGGNNDDDPNAAAAQAQAAQAAQAAAAAQAQQQQAAAAAAAAARGYVYAYPPYGYPGQPMMPGMPPGPPGAYMQGHFLPPMPYGPGMPPPNAMYSPAMGQMPPPGAYMSPPPGAYPPPPNGAQRPSMPPTPIPAHAHPYYHHQSPQMQHAVPYPMMMPPPGPPPGGPPPHPYDGQQQPVQMGGHA